MQGATVVTQRTTVTTTGASPKGPFALNTTYLRTLDGWLKVAQWIVSLIILCLLQQYDFTFHFSFTNFLHLTAFLCVIVTGLIMFSCMASLTGVTLMATLFYMNYHITAFVFYLCGGLACLIQAPSYHKSGLAIASGALGILACALYAIDAMLSLRGRFVTTT